MGDQDVARSTEEQQLRSFMRALLRDVRALEAMLEAPVEFFDHAGRIGAEQEMFLVDGAGRPSSKAMEILADLTDPRFVTELARYNLEANLTPLDFDGDCLSRLEAEMDECMALAEMAARKHGSHVFLAGILPTLRQEDLTLANMTPRRSRWRRRTREYGGSCGRGRGRRRRNARSRQRDRPANPLRNANSGPIQGR
jgi:hypothetical protein